MSEPSHRPAPKVPLPETAAERRERATAAEATWQPWQMQPLGPRLAREPQKEYATVPPASGSGGQQASAAPADQALEKALEAARRTGYAEGREHGYAAGLAEGRRHAFDEYRKALDVRFARQASVARHLVEQFSEARAALVESVGRQLTELALTVGRKLAGRALELQPDHILDDVQGLLEDYPGLGGSPTLYVSGGDLIRVRRYLGQALARAGWQLHADEKLQQGDCRIEEREREILSTAADRWERLLQAVGQQRQ